CLCTLKQTVNVGLLHPCGLVKSCHLVKSVSASLVTGRYFTHQTGLPKMPVPPLQQTCERYLSLLESIVEEDELKRTKALVEEFQKAGGVGERLQRRLEIRAENTDNWLADHVTRVYYLTCRTSVVVHSNVGGVFPRMDFRDKHGQIRCAAEMIAAVLEFKTQVENETLPVEYMGGKPLCMKQYTKILSSCRIPGLETDSLVFHAKSSNPPKHVIVAHNSQFFVLEVYNSDGTPLTVDQLYVQLERICNSSPESNAEPVGVLTTLDRDSWSKAYISLIKDETNKESLSAIERSICTVCLDGPMPQASDETYSRRSALQMLYGGGSQWNSANRWFDKSLQLIIGENGTHGFNASHAVCDGTVHMEKMQSDMVPLPMAHKLHFNITPDIKKDIEMAKQKMDIIPHDMDLEVLSFDHFGKSALKAHKMSPDAFIQIAIQLAYYRMHQRPCPSYETASLRTFKDGGIDIFPTTSSASVAFLKAFDDPKKQGVYGLLDCLRKEVDEENTSVPDIFTDPSYSTAFDNTVMGSLGFLHLAEPAGYNICYGPNDSSIFFEVKALKKIKEYNVAHFLQALEDALLNMMALLEHTPRAN
uniref:Carnitine O-acetyltransferase-like n=1 Tax=Stegastes partitus TaxID=144197 RepID=A0A3B5A8U2_9TELE